MTTFHERRLPHYYPLESPVFITWRLHGSLPGHRSFAPDLASGKAFVAMDRLLDNAISGPLYLHRPEIAVMVVEAIRFRHGREYELHRWVVMANHVHLLVTPHEPVPEFMQSLKRFTAREANKILGLTGSFWQAESYDRLVRDGTEFKRIASYIEMNPVKAGLVSSPELFPWSSAYVGHPLSGE